MKITNFLLPILSFLFCFVGNVFAEGEGYSLLAPIPTVTGNTQPDLVTYMKGLFTLFVGLSIVFAVFVIIYGGVKYTLAIVPGAKSDAKKRMTDAVLGLFIVLISSILLNTLNPGLLNIGLKLEDVQFDPTVEIGTTVFDAYTQYCFTNPTSGIRSNCYGSITTCQAMIIVHNPLGTTDNCMMYESYNVTTATGDEDVNRKLLTDTGHISINAGADRTQLSKVRPATLDEIKRVQAECNCNIMVTAGSETNGGHNCSNPDGFNHCNGYKVDLSSGGETGTPLSNYIMDHYTNIGKRGDGALQYQAPSGAIYALESNHWDVLVK